MNVTNIRTNKTDERKKTYEWKNQMDDKKANEYKATVQPKENIRYKTLTIEKQYMN